MVLIRVHFGGLRLDGGSYLSKDRRMRSVGSCFLLVHIVNDVTEVSILIASFSLFRCEYESLDNAGRCVKQSSNR